MRRLLLTLRFDGTRYHGWQVQKNAVTVQQKLQDAIQTVTGVRSGVTGCSRTDAGVHAKMFCCAFDTCSPLSGESMISALNANLPRDIAVYRCIEVPRDFPSAVFGFGQEIPVLCLELALKKPLFGGLFTPPALAGGPPASGQGGG